MEKYSVIGYINKDDVTFGFLIPIYEFCNQLFFHLVSSDKSHITAFVPYEKEQYEHEKNFVPLQIQVQKNVNDSSFFVFKQDQTIITGSYDDQKFSSQIEGAIRDIPPKHQFLLEEMKTLL